VGTTLPHGLGYNVGASWRTLLASLTELPSVKQVLLLANSFNGTIPRLPSPEKKGDLISARKRDVVDHTVQFGPILVSLSGLQTSDVRRSSGIHPPFTIRWQYFHLSDLLSIAYAIRY
jgi:hypothetical protein